MEEQEENERLERRKKGEEEGNGKNKETRENKMTDWGGKRQTLITKKNVVLNEEKDKKKLKIKSWVMPDI